MTDAASGGRGGGGKGIPFPSQYTGKALHQNPKAQLNGVFTVEWAHHCPQKHRHSFHTTESSSKRGVSRWATVNNEDPVCLRFWALA